MSARIPLFKNLAEQVVLLFVLSVTTAVVLVQNCYWGL